jgi:cell division protein ZapA
MIKMGEWNETVNISVSIAERQYPLKVAKSDEANVQQAAELVNGKINEYRAKFEGKDKQDYMAMCLLNFAVEHVTLQNTTQKNNLLLEEKMIQLEQVLSGTAK